MIQALRAVAAEEIETYERDGFVKLPGILPREWVDRVRETIDYLYKNGIARSAELEKMEEVAQAKGEKLLADGDASPTGRFCVCTNQRRENDNVNALCLEGPVPELAAQLFRTPKINFLIEQVFLKEPGAARRTAFHCDESYFNCAGEQCATFWIPADVVDKANGAMGYVPESHLWRRKFLPNNFVSQMPMAMPGAEGERIPDIEGNEKKYNVRYIESKPGDIIVHHYRTLHGSTGNTDPSRIRRALALRYGGTDLRYLGRTSGMVSKTLHKGDPMDSPDFPVVWEASRVTNSVFPTA